MRNGFATASRQWRLPGCARLDRRGRLSLRVFRDLKDLRGVKKKAAGLGCLLSRVQERFTEKLFCAELAFWLLEALLR